MSCHTLRCFQRDSQEALRVLSELRTVIAVRAKDTQERERCALLRQYPDYKFEEAGSAESVMSRTINNIGLASEDCHVAVISGDVGGLVQSVDSSPTDEPKTPLHCAHQVTHNTNHSDSSADINDTSCLYAKHVALLAVAKSQQMVAMSEDTFGDDNCSSDSDG